MHLDFALWQESTATVEAAERIWRAAMDGASPEELGPDLMALPPSARQEMLAHGATVALGLASAYIRTIHNRPNDTQAAILSETITTIIDAEARLHRAARGMSRECLDRASVAMCLDHTWPRAARG